MNERTKTGVIRQIYTLALVGLIIIAAFTYIIQYRLAEESVHKTTEQHAVEIAEEVSHSVKEFPAYRWLLQEWYEKADELDIEYDVGYEEGTRTRQKAEALLEKYPSILLRYLTEEEIKAMPEEDQKTYAEIAYTWLLTRVNDIKRGHDVDYLFCVVTDTVKDPYTTQFFLFSGADENSVRGTNYEEVYPLGVLVSIKDNESQQEMMHIAADPEYAKEVAESASGKRSSLLASAGNYVDYYSYLDSYGSKAILIGLTFDLSDLKRDIDTQTRRGMIYALLLESLLVLAIMYHTIMYVLRPLKSVQENIRLYTDTKDSAKVTENLEKILSGVQGRAVRENEIGELSGDIMTLAKEIDDYTEKIESITAEKERISTELDLAARIQSSMLPSDFPTFPERSEFDIYALMDPAKEVGGDFYDFFLIDEDHLCVLIADVSGKGIPAALFMMISKTILQSCAMLGRSPGEILEKTNEALSSNNQLHMFVSAWVGILEISTGKLICSNAGHEFPFLRKNGRYEMLKDQHGLVLGAMEGMKYQEYELELSAGDRIFVYTDGIPEAIDEGEQDFGLERLSAVLNRDTSLSCKEEIAVIREAVAGFVKDAPQFDDITMLCMEYIGKKETTL